MIIEIVALAAALGVGFGAGRVKNSKKLAAIRAEIAAVEGKVSADFSALVTKIKSLL